MKKLKPLMEDDDDEDDQEDEDLDEEDEELEEIKSKTKAKVPLTPMAKLEDIKKAINENKESDLRNVVLHIVPELPTQPVREIEDENGKLHQFITDAEYKEETLSILRSLKKHWG